MEESALSKRPLSYSVPWDLIFSHGRNFAFRTPVSIDTFTAQVVARMHLSPLIIGHEYLPSDGRFVLAANHYQRKGLWILHAAAALTHAIRCHYGPGEPPVRWVVTANWPRIRIGPVSLPSPGDFILPRVAEAWSCYPVSFHGSKPAYTAMSIRRILRDLPDADRPLGLFPEGVRGSAGRIVEPLPGIDRLLVMLARACVPVVPAGVSESGRLVIRFGPTIAAAEILAAVNAADLVMSRIRLLA